VHTIDAALLAQIAQVVGYFAIAINHPALQQRLRNVTEQTLVLPGQLVLRLDAPRIETLGMNSHHLAQAPHRKFTPHFLSEGAPYTDVLADYTGAFFKILRSSVTRFNSAFSRHIFSGWTF